MTTDTLQVACCIVGGGPAGMMAGLLLARNGVRVLVLEKHADFLRDFRGPMDVLWFHLTRKPTDPNEPVGSFGAGHILVGINRGDYWQCGFVIAKGTLEAVKAQGLETIRGAIAQLAPFLADRTGEILSFDDFKRLTVGVDRLTTWHKPGVLCIGDAAHTMSPIGGVGINLAIADAVATANILARPLREGRLTDADLASVQARRQRPTQIVQYLQVQIQKRVISGVLGSTTQPDPPLPLRLIARYPALARLPARLLGLGYRRERVMEMGR